MFFGADHGIVDFFGVVPVVKAPSSFSSCLLASLLVSDVGFLLALFGGVKCFDIRSSQIRLVHSSLSWLSSDWRHFLRP